MPTSTGTKLLIFGAILDGIAVLLLVIGLTQKQPAIALFAALPGLLGITLVIIGAIQRNREAKRRTGEGAKSGTAVGNYLADVDDVQELDGQPFVVHYQTPIQAKNGRPSKLMVRMECSTPTTLTFTKQTWLDRTSRAFGLSRKCQTEDAEFDASTYVRSPSLEYAESYCSDPAKRYAVLALRELGFTELHLTGHMVEASWQGFLPDKDDRPNLPMLAAAALRAMVTELPTVENPEAVRAARNPSPMWLWIFTLAYAAMVFAYIPYQPLQPTVPTLTGIALGLGIALVFALVAGWLLSGATTSHDKWKGLALVALLAYPAGTAGGIVLANGALDEAASTAHVQTIVNKRTSKSKNTTNYHIKILHWRRGNGELEFRVSASEWQAVTIGRSSLIVQTKPGFLGYEWWQGKIVRP